MKRFHCDECGESFLVIAETMPDPDDDIYCSDCDSNRAEAAYERQQERLMDGEIETEHEKYLKAWKKKQKAHKR